MNLYKVKLQLSFGGYLDATVYANSDIEARALVKQKFADLLSEITYSTQIPIIQDHQNDSKENFHIQI